MDQSSDFLLEQNNLLTKLSQKDDINDIFDKACYLHHLILRIADFLNEREIFSKLNRNFSCISMVHCNFHCIKIFLASVKFVKCRTG